MARPPAQAESAALIWGSKMKNGLFNYYRDAFRYDWPKTKLAWHKQALSKSSRSARVCKLLNRHSCWNVPALKAQFSRIEIFSFMVRIAYAVAKGFADGKQQQIPGFPQKAPPPPNTKTFANLAARIL